MKFSLASVGALALATLVSAGGMTTSCSCQEVVEWETETVTLTVAPGYVTPTSYSTATVTPTDCTACGYTIVGPLPQYIATEIGTTVTCPNGQVVPTTYTTGSTCTVNTACTVDKYGQTWGLEPITKTVTACEFPEPTLLPAGCAFETCVIPAWEVNGQWIPECTVTYTYWPEPSYYPESYPWTSTAWKNGSPVISIVNNISINIVTPTGAVWVPGQSGSVNPTDRPTSAASSNGPAPSGPGASNTAAPSSAPSSQVFVLASSDGTVGIVEAGTLEFVAADSSLIIAANGLLLSGTSLTDANGNVAKVNDVDLAAGGSAISFATAQRLLRRSDNTTSAANATLTWDFTAAGVLEAFYGDAQIYFSVCPPNFTLKLSLSPVAGNCTSITLVKKNPTAVSTATSTPAGTTAPTTVTDATTTPTTNGTTTPATTATTATTSSPSSSVPTNFADAMVYWHNQYRSLHGVPNVTWNQTLADYAANYATQCSTSHSGSPYYGENLAYGGYTNPSYYIYLWYNEIQNYNFSNPGFSKTTGHFTQVVWKDSIQIGCGWVSSCASTLGVDYPNYLACEYYPYGNVDGEYVTEVPAPTSSATAPIPGMSPFS